MTVVVSARSSLLSDEGSEDVKFAADEGDDDDDDEYEEELVEMSFGLDSDIYGATMFTILYDLIDLVGRKDFDLLPNYVNFARLFLILLMLVGNYILQIGLTAAVMKYITNPAVHSVQTLYREYHQQCWKSEGHFDEDSWNAFDGKDALCQLPVTNVPFSFSILCLWVLLVLQELKKVEQMIRHLHAVDQVETLVDMFRLCENPGTLEAAVGEIVIQGFTTPIRLAIYLLIVIPKAAISVYLLVVGLIWLFSTPNYAELILNGLALAFIIGIDELIYETVLPLPLKHQMENTRIIKRAKAQTSVADFQHDHWTAVLRSYRNFVLTLAITTLYMFACQGLPFLGVLPNYGWDVRRRCQEYYATEFARVCKVGEFCFPFGDDSN